MSAGWIFRMTWISTVTDISGKTIMGDRLRHTNLFFFALPSLVSRCIRARYEGDLDLMVVNLASAVGKSLRDCQVSTLGTVFR